MKRAQIIDESFEELWQRVVQDAGANGQPKTEFPLTAMTRAVFDAIEGTPPPTRAKTPCPAIDIGTGTAIHALAMLKRGYAPVYAVDVSDDAIRYAEERVRRLYPDVRVEIGDEATVIGPTASSDCADLVFSVCELDNLSTELVQQCSLITFNPPGYYTDSTPNNWGPIEHGVYVDRPNGTPQDSPLYRFMEVVVRALQKGGHAICSWPGLERRVVEAVPSEAAPGAFVHPIELLRLWFDSEGILFETDDVSCSARAFFSGVAKIGDYGLGKSFWYNLRRAVDSNRYSSLLNLTDFSVNAEPTFRFGVLHLIRCATAPTAFRLLHAGAPTGE